MINRTALAVFLGLAATAAPGADVMTPQQARDLTDQKISDWQRHQIPPPIVQSPVANANATASPSASITGTLNAPNAGSNTLNAPNAGANSVQIQFPKQAASAIAPNLSAGLDTCMGSTSAAGQAQLIGLSFGTTWTDAFCQRLRGAKLLMDMGLPDAAVRMLCGDKMLREALGGKC